MPISRSTISTASARSDAVSQRSIPPILRFTAGVLWLSNVSWKVSPDFGRSGQSCGSLCAYMKDGVTHPVLPGSSWLFEHVFSPHLSLFGWSTVLIETALAALLIAGRHVRVAAVVGVVQSIGIGLAAANADGEWYWSYGLMIALHLAVLATTGTVPRPSVSSRGLVVAGYGVVVALAHAGAGLTGDENGSWSLFDQHNGFPGDFGRNVFPGSILLGLVLIAAGLAVAFAVPRLGASPAALVGWTLLVLSLAVLVFVATPHRDGWLGVRNSSMAMFLTLAVVTMSRGSESTRTGRTDDPPGVLPTVPTAVGADGNG